MHLADQPRQIDPRRGDGARSSGPSAAGHLQIEDDPRECLQAGELFDVLLDGDWVG
jgi:hypothetical protein